MQIVRSPSQNLGAVGYTPVSLYPCSCAGPFGLMNILYCLLQKERGNADDEKENSNSQTKKVTFFYNISTYYSGYRKTSST